MIKKVIKYIQSLSCDHHYEIGESVHENGVHQGFSYNITVTLVACSKCEKTAIKTHWEKNPIQIIVK